MRALTLIAIAILISGCAELSRLGGVPQSLGERNSGFTYIPLDPLTINYSKCTVVENDYDKILDQLPDNAVRIAVQKLDGNAKAGFGPAGIGVSGEEYKVVLDYVNVDNTNIPFSISITKTNDNVDYVVRRLNAERQYDISSGSASVGSQKDNGNVELTVANGTYVIPIYVGVGLRLTATIKILKGEVNLSSLAGLGASVQAGNAYGSLVVQTLGVTGKQISNGLTFTSDLNETTIQNAILSLGKIKAVLYSKGDVVIRPRVTGMYLPLPDGTDELVNLIVSELARQQIDWNHHAC